MCWKWTFWIRFDYGEWCWRLLIGMVGESNKGVGLRGRDGDGCGGGFLGWFLGRGVEIEIEIF